jgi:methyl-accepting chemotaxis protein
VGDPPPGPPARGPAAAADRIADGDLDVTAEATCDDEVGRTASAFGRIVANLPGLVREIQPSTANLAQTSSEVAAAAEEVSAATEKLSAQTEATIACVTSLAEMARSLEALVGRFSLHGEADVPTPNVEFRRRADDWSSRVAS